MKAIFIYVVVFFTLIIISPIVFYKYIKYVKLGKPRDYKSIYVMNVRFFKWILFCAGVHVKVIGIENLNGLENGFLTVSNHQSYYDIPAASVVFNDRGLSFVAKESIKKVPFISQYMQIMNCLFLNRTSVKAGMKMIKDGNNLLKSGVNLIVFPEGTRTRNGEFLGFKAGSLKLATRVGAPIVPISISNSFKINPSSLVMKSGTITITINKPLFSDDYSIYSPQELNDIVEKIVLGGIL